MENKRGGNNNKSDERLRSIAQRQSEFHKMMSSTAERNSKQLRGFAPSRRVLSLWNSCLLAVTIAGGGYAGFRGFNYLNSNQETGTQVSTAVGTVAAATDIPVDEPVTEPTVEIATSDRMPYGCPIVADNIVLTQGYGVGTHAPRETWGAIDLARDGDGDGFADASGTSGLPVVATMDGTVIVTPNSHPGGNHIWLDNGSYRVGYAHLLSFKVVNGQQVRAKDVIGEVGNSGMSSGPHLDYQIWRRTGDGWENQNPLGLDLNMDGGLNGPEEDTYGVNGGCWPG